MSGRTTVLGPVDLVVPRLPDVLLERFVVPDTVGPFAEFVAVVRNDLPGVAPLTRITWLLNGLAVELDLAAGEVVELPVAVEPFPTENVLSYDLGTDEGATGRLRIIAVDPIGVPQGGVLRLATAGTDAARTTLLHLATAGPGRLGFTVAVHDRQGRTLASTPVRRLDPHASDVVDLTDLATLAGDPTLVGSVSVVWAAQGGTRLIGHATETTTRMAVPLEESGITPVPPSRAQQFLEPVAVALGQPAGT